MSRTKLQDLSAELSAQELDAITGGFGALSLSSFSGKRTQLSGGLRVDTVTYLCQSKAAMTFIGCASAICMTGGPCYGANPTPHP